MLSGGKVCRFMSTWERPCPCRAVAPRPDEKTYGSICVLIMAVHWSSRILRRDDEHSNKHAFKKARVSTSR